MSAIRSLRALLAMAMLPILLAGTDAAYASTSKPNILIIVADDAGFSDLGCYGGEIHTPNLDGLAANGLRFTQFYNTSRCWSTRAAILTGYYAQQVGMDPPRGHFPPWTRLLPHYLKPLGYRCYHSGKWHVFNAPRVCADGGFDHSYELVDHDNYFAPSRHRLDDRPLPPVDSRAGYYSTVAIADHAIGWLKEHAEKHRDKPFFTYLAFTAPHFPIQALPKDIARYKDTYAEGWEKTRARRYQRQREMGLINCKLASPEPKVIPPKSRAAYLKLLGSGETLYAVPWKTLSAEQKQLQAQKEAIHAAMIDRLDQEVGRVIKQLKAMGAYDNTIIFFLSDNGAGAGIMVRGKGHDRHAAPGSEHTFLCLGPGGSTVSNTPFRRHKTWMHEGGISTPLIVHWPGKITARGEFRHSVGHVVDLLPTLLELTGSTFSPRWRGATAPPLPGRSLAAALARDAAVPRDYVFFSHRGNRALRVGDWKIVSATIDGGKWELYNLARDRSETNNLAVKEPHRVKVMSERWHLLAARFDAQGRPGDPGLKSSWQAASASRDRSAPGALQTSTKSSERKPSESLTAKGFDRDVDGD
jgi:arylsulfatase